MPTLTGGGSEGGPGSVQDPARTLMFWRSLRARSELQDLNEALWGLLDSLFV